MYLAIKKKFISAKLDIIIQVFIEQQDNRITTIKPANLMAPQK